MDYAGQQQGSESGTAAERRAYLERHISSESPLYRSIRGELDEVSSSRNGSSYYQYYSAADVSGREEGRSRRLSEDFFSRGERGRSGCPDDHERQPHEDDPYLTTWPASCSYGADFDATEMVKAAASHRESRKNERMVHILRGRSPESPFRKSSDLEEYDCYTHEASASDWYESESDVPHMVENEESSSSNSSAEGEPKSTSLRSVQEPRLHRSESHHTTGLHYHPIASNKYYSPCGLPKNDSRQTPRPKSPGVERISEKSIEIAPGQYERLRGAEETWKAIACDFYMPCECVCCCTTIFCIQDAQYVLCPDCRVVSLMNDGTKECGEGVGIGFTMDDLAKWQREIEQGR